jgi:predicted nicotinamide N-methyase
MSHLSTLLASNLPSEGTAVQQRSYVTFSCLPPSSPLSEPPDEEPSVTLLERRNLISGSSTTGFRTWEAALHLGSYLLSSEASSLIQGKNVIELGAGTGFISILCAKHLGARHVTATDGDEGVVEALKENLFINGLDDETKVNASVLRWGRSLRGTWVDDECGSYPYDLVLGADIVSPMHAVQECLIYLLISPRRRTIRWPYLRWLAHYGCCSNYDHRFKL